MEFRLVAPFQPTGDQPEAIRQLVEGISKGYKHQVLLGATGTGKTYTMAQVITQLQRPALVMAHNKTLAAQLYAEFKEFFPDNAVEYFVSYYDYYLPEALRRWDDLLSGGKKVVAVGGSDAHSHQMRLGPLRRTVFPYEFHFSAINTHVYVPRPLGADAASDTSMILDALRQGHCFIGYDLPASTRGFRFIARGMEESAQMGDDLSSKGGVTFQVHLPLRTECVLLKDGKPMRTWHKHDQCTYITSDPGVYRVEVYIHYLGRRRGWIYSNPVYVR